MEEGKFEEIIRKLEAEVAAEAERRVRAEAEVAAEAELRVRAEAKVAAEAELRVRAEAEVAAEAELRVRAEAEVAELRVRAEAEVAELRVRAEAEVAAKNEEIMRLNFADKVFSLEQFSCRDGMMSFIHEAKFSSSTTLPKRVFQTADFFADEKSSITRTGAIKMSSFHRRQVANTADRMDLLLLDLTEKLKNDIFRRHRPSFYSDEAFKNVIANEVSIIEEIRVVFCWMLDNHCTALEEMLVQKVFVLYLEGLLKTIASKMSVLSANNVELHTSIEVEVAKQGIPRTVEAYGYTDVAVFRSTSEKESEVETTVCKVSLNDFLKTDTIIGEMKVCDGSLSRHKSKIGSCRSQQLIEIKALGNMRKENHVDDGVVKSFLTDFFVFGIALRVVRGPHDVVYLISSLYGDAEDMVFCILFLLADFSMDELLALIQCASPLEQDNGKKDDEVETESVFSLNDKIEIPPLRFDEVAGDESKSGQSEDDHDVCGRKRKGCSKTSTNVDGGGGGKRNGGGSSDDGSGAFSNGAGSSSEAGGGIGRARSGNPQGGHAKGCVSSSGNKSSGHGRTRSSGGAARPGQNSPLSPKILANVDPNSLHINRAAQRARIKKLAHEGKLVSFGNEASERREEAIREMMKWEFIRQSGIAPGSYLSASNLAAHDSLTSTK